jgi:Rrf2 family nitric oxide-sensitive transcriptional repressor
LRLTQFTDFALRLLVELARERPGKRITIPDASRSLGIPLNHLTKIVHRLAKANILKTSRGRSGGLALARPAESITVGQVVRVTEPDFALAGCMAGQDCSLAPGCGLAPVLNTALRTFLRVTDQATLADIAHSPPRTGTADSLDPFGQKDPCG